MSSSKPSANKRFLAVTLLAFGSATIGALMLVNAGQNYAHQRAAVLADMSAQQQINPLIGYRAASLLDSQKLEYKLRLAEVYLGAWKPDDAVAVISDPDNAESAVILSQASMELGRGGEADKLRAYSTDNAAAQLKLVEQASGKPNLSIAQRLYQHNMPQSALRVLEQLPSSVAREILVAQIELARPEGGKATLKNARAALDRGLDLDPSHTTLHELSREVYTRAGDDNGVQRETDTLRKLQNGTF